MLTLPKHIYLHSLINFFDQQAVVTLEPEARYTLMPLDSVCQSLSEKLSLSPSLPLRFLSASSPHTEKVTLWQSTMSYEDELKNRYIRSKSVWRWYISANIMFLDIIHLPDFI
jgi:hypothetical protein